MKRLRSLVVFVPVMLLIGGCSVPKEAGFPDVAAVVKQRSGHRIVWDQGGAADLEVKKSVAALLAREIAVDEAVQIALLNNRRLQDTYEELMIAQADVVQAGLLKNPVFSASVRFPIRGAGGLNVELGVEQDFLDLLMIPARKRVAEAQFEAVKLRVGSAVLAFAAEVRSTFYTLQGAAQIAAMRRTIGEAAEASADLARRQHEAGNISDLDLANEEALAVQIKLDLARSEAEILSIRERLIRLLGLWGTDTTFRLAPKLPDLPGAEPSLEHLESLAITQRLDIAAARKDVLAAEHALALVKNWRWIGAASVGASGERDSGGEVVVGPTVGLEIPIFDQKQAAVARLSAELRQRQQRLSAAAIDARSEVREARGRLVFARRMAAYFGAEVIPLRERIVALSQQQYDAMLLGVYQLLLAKQNEVSAYREYIEAVRDYWIARAELERAVGGRLLASSAPASRPAMRSVR